MTPPNPKYCSPADLTPVDLEHHEVARSLDGWFAPAEYRARYERIYPTRAPGSILPSDYCFNRDNKGNARHPRFLVWDGGTLYRFVGLAPDGAVVPPESTPEVAPTPVQPGVPAPADLAPIREVLLDFGGTIELEEFFPVTSNVAAEFSRNDPFAFAVASCLDRGKPSEVIWAIPYDLKQALGHLDPRLIDEMPEAELAEALSSLRHRARYTDAAPRTVKELARLIMSECDGDPERLWRDRGPAEVRDLFHRLHGVGLGIANMAVLLIARRFGFPIEGAAAAEIDIKPDVHTMRVLYRLGAAQEVTEAAAVQAARRIHPAFPGAIDGPLWLIGRRWCRPQAPNCSECPVRTPCARVDVG